MNLGDNISDLVKDLKDRVTSPFFSSFLISWLLFNWKVPVALFFYNQAELKAEGYTSLITFIQKNVISPYSFWLPIALALIYCFIFPFFTNIIITARAYFKAQGSNWELKYARDGKVPMSKYISLRQNLFYRTETLEKVLGHETETQKDF